MKRIAITTAIITFWGATSIAAIFGADDRRPVMHRAYELTYAKATALALLSTNFQKNEAGQLTISSQPASRFMCADEKFASDPSIDYSCTGFLVGPDLLATAGHCVANFGEVRNEKEKGCKAYTWLFDYRRESDGTLSMDKFSSAQLYHCKQIVYAVNEQQAPFRDFALIQLDRKVKRSYLPLDDQNPAVGQPVAMISHPFGTPAKVSTNAFVIWSQHSRQSFITNLDAVDGDSGSPVFGPAGVIGILIGGTPSQSLILDSKNKCQRVNKCDIGGSHCDHMDANPSVFPGFQRVGTEVQKLGELARAIDEFNTTRSKLK